MLISHWGPNRAKLRDFPVSYLDLIEKFLEFSKISFDYLNNLFETSFTELSKYNTSKNTETVTELIQRISLHFLGHMGQVYQIKRELGKVGTFVMGIKKKNRDDSRAKWLTWWKENKIKYK